MREIRPSGSVRGAGREVRPYRDHLIPVQSTAPFTMLDQTRTAGAETAIWMGHDRRRCSLHVGGNKIGPVFVELIDGHGPIPSCQLL